MLFVVLAAVVVPTDNSTYTMDQVKVSKNIEAQLLKLTTTIYRQHWMDTMQVDERAMISREILSGKVDLQPVLQAIVSKTLPSPVHERVLAEGIDETASLREAARLDEAKLAATERVVEPERKKMRRLEKVRRELGGSDEVTD